MCDHAPRSYHGPISDRHARTDGDIATQPTILTDFDGVSRLYGLAALQVVHRVVRCVERTVRADQGTAAYGDIAGIQEHAVVIDKDSLPKM